MKISVPIICLTIAGTAPAPAQVVATIADSTAIIEDLSWDGAARRFLVTDVHGGRLRSVTLDGRVADFGPRFAPGWALLGIAVDSARHVAWVTAVTMPMAAGYTSADSGRAAILRLDLRTGAVQKRFDLPSPSRAAPGDLAIADNHDVIVGDGMTGAVYLVGAADTLAPLVPAGRMRSTQQPAMLADGSILVPWYGRGLVHLDRAGNTLGMAPIVGIDGLVRSGNDFVAVYNGRNPNRIYRLALDSALGAVQRADTIAVGPGADDFNHVAVVDGTLYAIVHAGWSKYEDDGRLKPGSHPLPKIVRLTF